MVIGKVYGGVKTIALPLASRMIEVECCKCLHRFQADRSNVRSGKIKSCGRFSCRTANSTWNDHKKIYEGVDS